MGFECGALWAIAIVLAFAFSKQVVKGMIAALLGVWFVIIGTAMLFVTLAGLIYGVVRGK